MFRLAGREFGLPLDEVVEVFRIVAVTPLPESAPWVLGFVNVRGRIVPVVDLRLRLAMAPLESDLSTPMIFAEDASSVACLVVDELVEVLTLSDDAVEVLKPSDGSVGAVSSLVHVGERLVLILDLGALCQGVGDINHVLETT